MPNVTVYRLDERALHRLLTDTKLLTAAATRDAERAGCRLPGWDGFDTITSTPEPPAGVRRRVAA